MKEKDLENRLQDPENYYKHPDEVLQDQKLSHEQKIKVLQSWALDARELLVAEEENMTGGATMRLDQIMRALEKLKLKQ